MADIAEIQMKIKAVEFALGSFADYENEEERRNFLRQNFSAIPGLKTYFVFSETELKDEEKQLQEMEILLLALQKRDSSNQFRYFKVSARITNSKGFRAWRAKTFVLADDCNGFYCAGGEPESIYYEENTLVLNVLFKSEDDARRFRSALERRALNFCIISSVTVSESYEEVVLPTRAREIHATHYVHGESDSPQHSLAVSDYKSQADEDEDHHLCHLASNKKDKDNQNNLLILSWTTLQCFDGLNLVTKQHMVPSIAIQFVEFQGRETLEFTNGYPFQKDKVAISVESPDPKVLEGIGLLLKAGSSVVDGKLHSFVHVDSWEEFKKFLTIKYVETTRLWEKHLPLGSLLPEGEVVETGRSKRIRSCY
eukprot:scaffold622_cov174-Ochromonas_danica.AAC.1